MVAAEPPAERKISDGVHVIDDSELVVGLSSRLFAWEVLQFPVAPLAAAGGLLGDFEMKPGMVRASFEHV